MKNSMLLALISLSLLTLIACSKQDDGIVIDDSSTNTIRMELELVIADREVVEIWGLSIDDCSSVSFYDGTQDFEFMEHFIRIEDKYFQYDHLVSFETDRRANGNQMLLCFN